MIELLGLGLLILSAVLLAAMTRLRRRSVPRLRPIAGLTRLHRAFGLSVEDGSRLLISLGAQSSAHAARGRAHRWSGAAA